MKNNSLAKKLDDLCIEDFKKLCDAPVVLRLVKEILKSKDVVNPNGSINLMIFAEYYAYALSSLVHNEPYSDDYDEVYDTHRDWGYSIGDALNNLLKEGHY
jgi:hypothetical protein